MKINAETETVIKVSFPVQYKKQFRAPLDAIKQHEINMG